MSAPISAKSATSPTSTAAPSAVHHPQQRGIHGRYHGDRGRCGRPGRRKFAGGSQNSRSAARAPASPTSSHPGLRALPHPGHRRSGRSRPSWTRCSPISRPWTCRPWSGFRWPAASTCAARSTAPTSASSASTANPHHRARPPGQHLRVPLAVAACLPRHQADKAEVTAEGQFRGRQCRTLHVLRQLLHHVPGHALGFGEGDGIVLMVGGKVSNRISMPKFSKVVVAYIPNEPPRWPTLTRGQAHRRGLRQNARKYERWAIGPSGSAGRSSSRSAIWNSPITASMTSAIRAYYTWRQSSQFKFTKHVE